MFRPWFQGGRGRCSDLGSRGGGGRCLDLGSRGEGVDVQTLVPGGGRWLTISVAHLPPPVW